MPQVARPIEMNTAETRLARIETRLKRLEAENAELKAQLDKFNEVSRRVIIMPQGCTAGFANGLTVGGVKEAFGSKLFPILTCRAGE
jgi:hypothetical protein